MGHSQSWSVPRRRHRIGRQAEVMRKAGMNIDLVIADWGTTAGRQSNKDTPAQGGWHLGTNMACNGKK